MSGKQLLTRLSRDLTERFGPGFSADNLELMRRFYRAYPMDESPARALPEGATRPISETMSRHFSLPWSHYVRLLALDEPAKRDFYEEEARRGGWTVRQLDRQIDAMLYERLALSRRKGELCRRRRSA